VDVSPDVSDFATIFLSDNLSTPANLKESIVSGVLKCFDAIFRILIFPEN
jgi:hypothetical protein